MRVWTSRLGLRHHRSHYNSQIYYTTKLHYIHNYLTLTYNREKNIYNRSCKNKNPCRNWSTLNWNQYGPRNSSRHPNRNQKYVFQIVDTEQIINICDRQETAFAPIKSEFSNVWLCNVFFTRYMVADLETLCRQMITICYGTQKNKQTKGRKPQVHQKLKAQNKKQFRMVADLEITFAFASVEELARLLCFLSLLYTSESNNTVVYQYYII